MGAKPREAKGGVGLRGGKMRRRVPGGRVMGGGEMALWAREVGGARGGGVPGAGPRGRGGGAAEAGAAGRRDWKAERGPAPAGGWKSLLPARRGQRLEEAGVGGTRRQARWQDEFERETLRPGNVAPHPRTPRLTPASQPS